MKRVPPACGGSPKPEHSRAPGALTRPILAGKPACVPRTQKTFCLARQGVRQGRAHRNT